MSRTKKTKSIDGPTKGKDKIDISMRDRDDDSFVVNHIESDEDEEIVTYPVIREHAVVTQEPEAVEKVKVSFDSFVKLVASHNYEDVIDKNKDEPVIVSSNLLADLANAHEQEEERRIPAIFIIGVLVGIVITYILLTY
ncbi:hypothetical protein C0416_02540 [bacterium]|nr:hypothetical protein [bacterium]